MASEETQRQSENEEMAVERDTNPEKKTLHALPFAVQLQNVFVIEIVARRFPTNIAGTLSTQSNLNIEDVQVDSEHLQAQAILNVQVGFQDEPRPFEISFKMVGHFVYTQEYKAEMVQQFLQQGSFSIMLPFARELLISLCTRLQVPPLMLQMVQLAPPPLVEIAEEDASY
jgi:preprotein translocase subunit SecB